MDKEIDNLFNIPDHDILIGSLNHSITELISKGIKIYDADNRDFYLSEFMYSSEDYRIVFEMLEDKDSLDQVNPYDKIIKLSAENSDLKKQLLDQQEQIEALIKLQGGNAKVIEALQNQFKSSIELEEEHNVQI